MKPAHAVTKLCYNLQFQNDINKLQFWGVLKKTKPYITYQSQGFEILRL